MAYIAEDKITNPIEKQKVKAVLAECNRRNRRPLWILKRVMDVTLSLIALVILNCRINCHLVNVRQLGAKLFFDELFSVHHTFTLYSFCLLERVPSWK